MVDERRSAAITTALYSDNDERLNNEDDEEATSTRNTLVAGTAHVQSLATARSVLLLRRYTRRACVSLSSPSTPSSSLLLRVADFFAFSPARCSLLYRVKAAAAAVAVAMRIHVVSCGVCVYLYVCVHLHLCSRSLRSLPPAQTLVHGALSTKATGGGPLDEPRERARGEEETHGGDGGRQNARRGR